MTYSYVLSKRYYMSGGRTRKKSDGGAQAGAGPYQDHTGTREAFRLCGNQEVYCCRNDIHPKIEREAGRNNRTASIPVRDKPSTCQLRCPRRKVRGGIDFKF